MATDLEPPRRRQRSPVPDSSLFSPPCMSQPDEYNSRPVDYSPPTNSSSSRRSYASPPVDYIPTDPNAWLPEAERGMSRASLSSPQMNRSLQSRGDFKSPQSYTSPPVDYSPPTNSSSSRRSYASPPVDYNNTNPTFWLPDPQDAFPRSNLSRPMGAPDTQIQRQSPERVVPRGNLSEMIGADDAKFDREFTIHQDASGGNAQIENADDVPCQDFFFQSDKVLSLNGNNFTSFLTRKDATLVIFYKDDAPKISIFKSMLSEAAGNTKRENHAFAAVDCNANPKLCSANGVVKVPMMRLYSKNYCIGEMKTITGMSADILRQYVEMAPISDCSRMVACSRKC